MSGLVTVGIPVFKGEHLAETLASLRMQSYKNLEIVISVDGEDDSNYDECICHLIDERIKFSRRNCRLGWVGNTNWLINQAEGECFCFFQQDDLADHTYIERLKAALAENQCAVVAYPDVKWFGYVSHDFYEVPLTGSLFDRMLTHVEQLGWVPLQGLVSLQAIKTAGTLRLTEFQSCLEDQVWIASLACIGEIIRVPGLTYYKRDHSLALHREWRKWTNETRLNAWIVCLSGVAERFITQLRTPSERLSLMAVLLDRLLVSRTGRWMFCEIDTFSVEEKSSIAGHFFNRMSADGFDPAAIISSDWKRKANLVLHSIGIPGM